jgi:DNA-binding NtrC family response regulator
MGAAGRETADETSQRGVEIRQRVPGIVLVHSGESPALRASALDHGHIGIGRDDPVCAMLADERLSRHHAEIAHKGDRWTVRDLDSRNGTFVDGMKVVDSAPASESAVVRAGGTIALLSADVRPLIGGRVVEEEGVISGPRLGATLAAARRAGSGTGTLLVTGESGAGKELVARAFHTGSSKGGAFVAVNCATIPQGLAERLLFGAKRGAYSGAMGDVDGYVQAAEGGVLFLDEIGELELAVQAKLLRVLETKEIVPLGSATGRRANVRFCYATHRDLRAEAAAGRFRADLYYRLSETEVTVPALRERREEIPWLIASFARRAGIERLHAKLVDQCLRLPWPGNVRELAREVRHVAEQARSAGEDILRLEHLRSNAGGALAAPPSSKRLRRSEPTRESVTEALAREHGNISAAARALGLHRTQLRRAMEKLGVRVPEEK